MSDNTQDNFIIFSLARCGSTTLMSLLNCHQDIRCVHEPFNPTSHEGQFHRHVSSTPSLVMALENIWGRYNGIKHVWGGRGWPFLGKEHLNKYLLQRAAPRVVFLNRRNILRRAVSDQISKQAKVWGITREEDRYKLLNFRFEPLDVAWIRQRVKHETAMVNRLKRLLVARGVKHLEVWYEDVYDSPSIEVKMEKYGEILHFLGRPPLADTERMGAAKALLEPKNMKVNNHETYMKVPGIEQVEREFGSDETGWLFK
jgi:hypothetical protein